MTRRLVAGDDEQREVVVEVLVGERNPVLGHLVREDRDEVLAVATDALVAQVAAVVPHVLNRRRTERQVTVLLRLGRVEQVLGVIGVGVRDHLVAPLDELARVLTDREVRGDLLDEVELAVRRRLLRLVDGVLRQLAQERLVVLQQVARRELALDELAQRGVTGAVRLEDGAAEIHEVVVDVLEVDELLRRERLGILVDDPDVVVLRDGPEALAVALLRPVHRVGVTQRVELRPSLVVAEAVDVGQVDVGDVERGVGLGSCALVDDGHVVSPRSAGKSGRVREAPGRGRDHRW